MLGISRGMPVAFNRAFSSQAPSPPFLTATWIAMRSIVETVLSFIAISIRLSACSRVHSWDQYR
ncbi:hypothetical protein D3C81_736240 [compost metagenome]